MITISNYFKNHWKGKLSLNKSFWINFVLLSCIIRFSIGYSIPTLPTIGIFQLFVMLFTLWAAVYVWQFIGCWRSARIQKSNSNDSFAGAAVQVSLVASLFFVLHLFPTYLDYIKISTGNDNFSRYKIKVKNGEIIVTGDFSYGLETEIDKILKQNDDIWNVSLNSRGGRIDVAKKIADLIELRKLSTYVPNACVSACVRAFMAGSVRVLGENAQIGLHSSYVAGLTDYDRRASLYGSLNYLKNKGASDRFIKKATNTPPEDVWYPTTAELIQNNIITHLIYKKKLIDVDDLRRSAKSGEKK